MAVRPGQGDVSRYFVIRLRTPEANKGEAATGIAATAFTFQYTRNREPPVGPTPGVALAAADSIHTDYGVFEIDPVNSPGLYRFDWPNPAFWVANPEVHLSITSPTTLAEHEKVDLGNYVVGVEPGAIQDDSYTVNALAAIRDATWNATGAPEPSGVPAVNAPVLDQLSWIYFHASNTIIQDRNTQTMTLRNRADTADISIAPATDTGGAGGAATKGPWS